MDGRDKHPVDARGFSLVELLVGLVILFLILGGTVMISRNASTSTPQSRELSDKSTRLSDFMDSIRNFNNLTPNSLPIDSNKQRVDLAVGDTVWWEVCDCTCATPLKQPFGQLLLSAKLTWKKQGRMHSLEDATFLHNP